MTRGQRVARQEIGRWRHLPTVILLAVALAGLSEAFLAWRQGEPTVSDEDWVRVEAYVRAGFQPGDLLVFAPAWYEPVGREHLGDLLDVRQMSRPDDAEFRRIWVVARRGATYPARGTLKATRHFGGLVVYRFEQSPVRVLYDFFDHIDDARVFLLDRAGRLRERCPWRPARKRHQCRRGWNNVRQKLAEVDYRLRRCIYAHPTDDAILVVEFPQARLGERLVVWSGLDDYDARLKARRAVRQAQKKGREPRRLYPVHVRILVDGRPLGAFDHPIDEAWHRHGFRTRPTPAATVRFEISTRFAYGKIFCFYPQARSLQ